MGDEATGVFFELEVPLSTAWQDEVGELWFEGVASSTALDRQQERMSAEAIAHMSQCAGLPLVSGHPDPGGRELGTVEECWVDSEQFRVKGRLDREEPHAWRLLQQVNAGRQYGLSVGGRVRAAHWEDDGETGDRVRVIDGVSLDHIAVCRPGQAANPDTYLRVMARAAGAVVGGVEADANGPGEARGLQSVANSIRNLWRGLFRGRSGWNERARGVATELSFLRGDLAEVRSDLAALSKAMASGGHEGECNGGEGESVAEALEAARRQHTQGIDGQEKHGGMASHFWKGVL